MVNKKVLVVIGVALSKRFDPLFIKQRPGDSNIGRLIHVGVFTEDNYNSVGNVKHVIMSISKLSE